MKHLYRVVRCPKGTAPAYLPWHHLWLALGLTALGLLLGWLTMPLAAVSSPDLSAQDLWVWYMSSVDLWYRNLLPPVLLIWLLYFLTLTMPLAAVSSPDLSAQDLWVWYMSSVDLWYRNLLPPVLLIWLLYFLTGRCWLSYLLTALPALGVALANYFKIQLRGDPLLASDLKLISEAGGIMGNYSLDMTPLIQQTLGWAGLGLVLALLLLPRGLLRRDIRIFGLLSAAAVMGTAFLTLYCNEASYRRTTAGSELVNPWSDTEVFVSHGVLYPFLYSVQDMLPVPPEGYQEAVGSSALERFPEEAIPEDKKVSVVGIMLEAFCDLTDFPALPPEGYQEAVGSSALERFPEEAIPEDKKVSVVGIMLEAFCDLTDFPALAEQEDVQEVYAPWHALEKESVSGDLLTNIFAGGTVDTEWCFLTGYSQYEEFRNNVDSYVWYFDRQGYQTRGGHPGFGWFYNRQNVNRFLGFQEYWFTENHYGELVDPVEAQWNSDLLLVDEIVKDLRSCLDGEGRPVFSFSVSYQNHGPYEWTYTAAQWNSDLLLVDEIVKDLRSCLDGEGRPVFSFSVSYQNHGPYEWTYTANETYLDPETSGFPEEACYVFNNYLHGVNITISAMTLLHGPYEWTYTANETYLDPETSGFPEEACYVFNNYLHGVNITISAMTLLAQQLEELEEPVVLVLFGDHKPWGGNSNDVFNNYLHGVNITISAMTLLAQQLEELEEPVVLVLFGDHKPWGGNSNDAYYGIGASFDTTTLEGFYQYYSTPYLIWANSAAKETLGREFQGEGGDFSPCFLMPELFEQCGWTGPSFLQLSQEVREITPLVHQQGVYLTEDGQLTDRLSGEAADRLNEFFFAQYYREHKVVPEGAG